MKPIPSRFNRLASELPQPHAEQRIALLAFCLGLLPAIALAYLVLA